MYSRVMKKSCFASLVMTEISPGGSMKLVVHAVQMESYPEEYAIIQQLATAFHSPISPDVMAILAVFLCFFPINASLFFCCLVILSSLPLSTIIVPE